VDPRRWALLARLVLGWAASWPARVDALSFSFGRRRVPGHTTSTGLVMTPAAPAPLTLAEFRRQTRALDGPVRLQVFERLPDALQEGAWSALAAEWDDHRRRDWRAVLEDQGVAA